MVHRAVRGFNMIAAVAFLGYLSGCVEKENALMPAGMARVQGVRFDPSYHYNIQGPLRPYIDSMVTAWRMHGINTVFFKAYDPEYGGVYKTDYRYNRQTDYGKTDFMRNVLEAAHKNDMRFIVWLPVLEHKGAWDAEPKWRVRDQNGADLIPYPDRHFLCSNTPGVREWWEGFVKDILARYPSIDGIDLAEPASVWKDRIACSCDECRKKYGSGTAAFSPTAVDARAADLTDVLLNSCAIARKAGKISCLTCIPTVNRSTRLLSFSAQKLISGFDLDKLLDSPDHPDWISLELMWQQWADTYDDPKSFTPVWTKAAVEEASALVAGRTHLLAHLELTPLGPVEVTPGEFAATIEAARRGGAQSIDFYDVHLADSMDAWGEIQEAFNARSDRKAIVFYDEGGLGLARQIATLFGHFDVKPNVVPIDSFSLFSVTHGDLVVYLGTRTDTVLPASFLSFAKEPDARLLWLNFNLAQLPGLDSVRHLAVREIKYGQQFPSVLYKGKNLFKTDSVMTVIDVLDTALVRVHAWAIDMKGGRYPYAVQSGNFWYIADCPVDYMAEGCRHIVVADLLHQFIGEDHPEQHTALVRIEDVCALSDPQAIRRIADLLWSEKVPFAISLVPFYVDPQENTATSISEKPALVNALRYAVSKGAAIIMHGSTHQYRGRTTGDYEFWDAIKNGPLFEDSEEYVRIRLQRGLKELHKNGLFPVAFETPHYAASRRDYGVIDRYFSAEYGRRQVIDKKGFDQLLPYLIERSPDGGMLIPENLGYIPTDKQDVAPVLRFAENNLAVRDGYASFFFHPWIDSRVLKDLVKGIRAKGYQFSDIRLLPLSVVDDGFVQTTGNRRITLNPTGQYLHTFYIDRTGRKREEWYSDGPVSEPFTREAAAPPGWIFVAENVVKRPSFFSGFSGLKSGWPAKIKAWLFTEAPLKPPQGKVARVWLLWDSSTQYSSQQAFYQYFHDCAIPVETVPVERFFDAPDSINLIVLPSASARRLSSQQSFILGQAVAAGMGIILEGPSEFARLVGIRVLDSSKLVRQVKDEYFPDVPITWKKPSVCYGFEADVKYVTQYSSIDETPVVAGGEYGDGMYLFFATSFVDPGDSGPGKFPFFLDMLQRQFGLYPVVRKANLEVCFDPGTRADAEVEDLVRMWRQNGVRIVHTATWLDQADFDYGYFVEQLHRNGMLGLAWFDLPFISENFWSAHPRWREVTAAGGPAHIGWRYLMDMANDTCRAGAFSAIKRSLMLADWDGVNLSGSMFEGDNPDSAENVTPMNSSVRESYARAYGYDPALIFDAGSARSYRKNRSSWATFKKFRDSLEAAIIGETVGFINKYYRERKQIVPVVITRTGTADVAESRAPFWRLADSNSNVQVQLAPRMPEGIDVPALRDFLNTLFTERLGWNPMIEVNLDALRPKSGITGQLCGAELMNLVAEANKQGIRLTLRTEENIFDVDFKVLSRAAAAGAAVRLGKSAWSSGSQESISFDVMSRGAAGLAVDDRIWPVQSRGAVLMPGGTHTLTTLSRFNAWRSLLLSSVKILDFPVSIIDARSVVRGLRLSYDSDQTAPLILSNKVHSVYVDGLPLKAPSAASDPMMLPAGRHDVSVVTRTVSGALLREASIGLSGAIVLVSSFTIGIFLILYFGAVVFRRARKSSVPGSAVNSDDSKNSSHSSVR